MQGVEDNSYEEYLSYRKNLEAREKEIIKTAQVESDEMCRDTTSKFYKKEKELEEEKIKEEKEKIIKSVVEALVNKNTKLATEHLKIGFKNLNPCYAIRSDSDSEIYIYKDGIYVPEGKTHIKQFCEEIIGFKVSSQIINEVILKIEISSYIDADDFYNAEPKDEVILQNCIFNLKTKETKRYTPRKIFFNKLPFYFDPKAKPSKSIEFISEILENPEDIILVQELFGYLLLKDYQIEKAFMMWGKGRNGKGQLLELIKTFVGVDNCSAVSLQRLTDESSFNIVELHKKLVNIGGDISDTSLQETGLFKSLTGNDLISCDRKFKNHLKFRNYAKLIFSCNKLPKSKDNSRGFWDRWILLKFPFRFEYAQIIDKLPDEEKKLCKIRKNNVINDITTQKELSGLFNWALEGLQRIINTQHFTFTKATQDVQKRWIKEADSFAAFCDEHVLYEYDGQTGKDDLRQAYNEFCKENQVEITTDRHIKYYLETEMRAVIKRTKASGVETQDYWFWKNIILVNIPHFPHFPQQFELLGKNDFFARVENPKESEESEEKSNDLVRLLAVFGNKPANSIDLCILEKKFTTGILQQAKELGFIIEIKKNVFQKV